MAEILRAISIRQPYAELILRGTKPAEYRSRRTNIRERVYIYASLRPADDTSGWRKVGREPGQLPTGVIVGSVEITACKVRRRGKNLDFAYALRNPKRFRNALLPTNQPQPGFWRPRFKKERRQI